MPSNDKWVLVPRYLNFDLGSILDQRMGPDSTWEAIIEANAKRNPEASANGAQITLECAPAQE